jgi:hypothetical protein
MLLIYLPYTINVCVCRFYELAGLLRELEAVKRAKELKEISKVRDATRSLTSVIGHFALMTFSLSVYFFC